MSAQRPSGLFSLVPHSLFHRLPESLAHLHMQSAAKGYGISPSGTVMRALDIVLWARLAHCVLYRIIIYQFNCTITVVCVHVCLCVRVCVRDSTASYFGHK